MRSGRLILAASILAATCCVATIPWIARGCSDSLERDRGRSDLGRFAPDVIRIKAACSAMRDVYALNGRLLRTLGELEASWYYPYSETYAQSLFGGTLEVDLIEAGEARFLWLGKTDAGEVSRPGYQVKASPSTKELRTKRAMAAYLAGIRRRSADAERIRNDFAKQHDSSVSIFKARYGQYPLVFTRRYYGRPTIKGDLPAGKPELVTYLDWVKHTEGLAELIDAWGRVLSFSINRGSVSCRSAGPDGVLNSNDDLLYEVARAS
jgi:hypothetical protein